MVRLLSFVLVLLSGIGAQAAEVPAPALLYGFPQMQRVREAVLANDPSIAVAYDKRLLSAHDALLDPPEAVTDKGSTDALGLIRDPHDYGSVATYNWAVPGDPRAPWQGIDGSANTSVINRYDDPRLSRMLNRVTTLTLAWWLSGNQTYATAAVQQLNTWFIDARTAMRPNFEYAQIKINTDGNIGIQTGIVDGRKFVPVLSVVALLDKGGTLPAADRRALRLWFSQFSLGCARGHGPFARELPAC